MRRLFAPTLLALACAVSPVAEAAKAQAPASAALEVFTLRNTLANWSAQGLREAGGRVVFPAQARELVPLRGGGWLARIGLGGEVLDARGQRVAGPFDYVEEPDPALDVLLIGIGGSPILDNKGGLVRNDGTVVAAPDYLGLHSIKGTGLFAFQRARRFGAMDAQGRIVIEPVHDSLDALGPLVLAGRRGQWALFDRSGKALTEFRDGVAYQSIEGLDWIRECVAVAVDDVEPAPRCRVLDAKLKPAFAGEFSQIDYLPSVQRWVAAPYVARSSEDNIHSLASNRKLSLLGPDGRRIAQLEAVAIRAADAGRLIVSIADSKGYRELQGLADRDGRWLFAPKYHRIDTLQVAFSHRIDGQTPPVQFSVLHWVDGGDYQTAVIDADGRTVLPMSDKQISEHYPSLGLYLAKQGELTGVLDRNGQWRIAPRKGSIAPNSSLPPPYLMFSEYDYSGDSGERSRYTLYDLRSGQPALPGDYNYLSPEDSYWPLGLKAPWPEFVIVNAQRGGKAGVIDLHGNVVVPFEYDNINSPDRWGRVTAYRDGGDNDKGTLVDGLPPQRMAELAERVSRQIREQHAPLASAHAPYAGRYVPVEYTDAAQVQAAAARGALSRPVAPMILADGDTAILDLGMVRHPKRPQLDYLEYYCPREDGFDILMPGAGLSEDACAEPKAPRLALRNAGGEEWNCTNCAGYGLPERWRRTDPAPNPALP